jgi:hypothetical protein
VLLNYLPYEVDKDLDEDKHQWKVDDRYHTEEMIGIKATKDLSKDPDIDGDELKWKHHYPILVWEDESYQAPVGDDIGNSLKLAQQDLNIDISIIGY